MADRRPASQEECADGLLQELEVDDRQVHRDLTGEDRAARASPASGDQIRGCHAVGGGYRGDRRKHPLVGLETWPALLAEPVAGAIRTEGVINAAATMIEPSVIDLINSTGRLPTESPAPAGLLVSVLRLLAAIGRLLGRG